MTWMQISALGFIAFGELSVIYAEQLGAKLYGVLEYPFGHAFFLTLIPLIGGALCLVTGYMLGLKHFQNIWPVIAISFGSILILEPLFGYFFIGDVPEFGQAVGFTLGALGILAVIFL